MDSPLEQRPSIFDSGGVRPICRDVPISVIDDLMWLAASPDTVVATWNLPQESLLPVQRKAASSAQSPKLTQQELGEAMGYEITTARHAVSQFLKSKDPRISMLRKFATAVEMDVSELI